MVSEGTVLLEASNVSLSFPGVKALDHVDFTLRRGEVHALMGQNGAGKSTLIKVLSGVCRRDEGSLRFKGREVSFGTPLDAQRAGIATVHQEVNLIPTLSVAENLFLGAFPRRGLHRIDWARMFRESEELLARLNLRIDVSERLESYSIAVWQLVAIARALRMSSDVLILDEPTSSLDAEETALLFDVMRDLKQKGLGILFVTHFLEQMYEVADRVTVLRNGCRVGEYEVADLPRIDLVTAMVGRQVEEGTGARRTEKGRGGSTPFLDVRGAGRSGAIEPLDLSIGRGEVVGLAGLLGSGRSEAARMIFGADPADRGEFLVEGRRERIASPSEAIALGFGFCPEDRKADGLVGKLSVRENIILVLQTSRGWARLLRRAEQERIADRFIRALQIKTPGAEQAVEKLSGGNQQKVVIARWLASNLRFLILDEPTRGIDVAAKFEIQKLILSLADDGLAVLFISSELDETVRCCGRVAVLRDRRKVEELSGADVNRERILQAIANA